MRRVAKREHGALSKENPQKDDDKERKKDNQSKSEGDRKVQKPIKDKYTIEAEHKIRYNMQNASHIDTKERSPNGD